MSASPEKPAARNQSTSGAEFTRSWTPRALRASTPKSARRRSRRGSQRGVRVGDRKRDPVLPVQKPVPDVEPEDPQEVGRALGRRREWVLRMLPPLEDIERVWMSAIGHAAGDCELVAGDDRGDRRPGQLARAADLASDEERVVRGRPHLPMVAQHDVVDLLRRILALADDAAAPDLELGGQAVDHVAWLDLGDRNQVIVLVDQRMPVRQPVFASTHSTVECACAWARFVTRL